MPGCMKYETTIPMIKAHFSPGHAAVSCAGAALPGGAFERSTGGAAVGAPRVTWMMLTIGEHSDSEIGISNLAESILFPVEIVSLDIDFVMSSSEIIANGETA